MNPTTGPVLRDIHLPPPPGWWPPAPGWWLLAAILLAALASALLLWRNKRRMRRQRLAILGELDRIITSAGDEPAALAAALSQFLRRLALRDTPQAAVYQGERWLGYLDERSGGEEFRAGIGRALVDAPFRPAANYDTVALAALVRRWTRNVLNNWPRHA